MFAANKYAPTNPFSPEPVGICRRCGFLWPLAQLDEQYQWLGPKLGKILTRVCRKNCLDRPQEQLRTIVIGPDPVPPFDASPYFYAQQNAAPGFTPPSDAPLTDDYSQEFWLTDDQGNPITTEGPQGPPPPPPP